MLSAQGIHLKLGNRYILRDISFAVGAGKALSVLGANGSGKSTLLKAIGKLIPLEAGTICAGKEGAKIIPVLQNPFLWPHISVEKNILYAVSESVDHSSEFQEIVSALNIQHLLKKSPRHLSGGEQQRISLARALILKPDVLLLDEVTSAQDVSQVFAIYKYLSHLKASGVTLIFNTHSINFAKKLADDYIFLYKSVIEDGGRIDQLEDSCSLVLKKFLAYM